MAMGMQDTDTSTVVIIPGMDIMVDQVAQAQR
jgi:hypothetical protein